MSDDEELETINIELNDEAASFVEKIAKWALTDENTVLRVILALEAHKWKVGEDDEWK